MKTQPHITIFVCAVFFTVLISTSCKDKIKKSYCEENPSGCQSVLVAKDFFAFKLGSWWVYEEETSHERDSLYVTESYNNSTGYDFLVKIKSSLTDYEYRYWPFFAGGNNACSETSPVEGKCIYIKRSKGKPGEYVGEDNCFFVNFKIGYWTYAYNNIYFENNRIIVDNIVEKYTLNYLSFNQTVKIHELSTVVEGVQPTNHYFARNVGLIRKELLDSNEVWNLVNYHIQE